MTEKEYKIMAEYMSILYVDIGKKPTREEIIEELMNQEPMISDEEAFERHLIRRWSGKDE